MSLACNTCGVDGTSTDGCEGWTTTAGGGVGSTTTVGGGVGFTTTGGGGDGSTTTGGGGDGWTTTCALTTPDSARAPARAITAMSALRRPIIVTLLIRGIRSGSATRREQR